MTPETENQLLKDVSDIKLAVVGDERLEIDGLAKQVRGIQRWRKRLDLRVAGISGGAAVLLFLIKFFVELAISHR